MCSVLWLWCGDVLIFSFGFDGRVMTGGRLLFISNFDLSRRVRTGHVAATGKLEMDASV